MDYKSFSLNTNDAQVVSAIKDTMNIAAAAAVLKIPKTTLSSTLSKLEKKLGGILFIRKQGSGEVTITDFGHEIIPKLEKILWISESMRPKKGIEGERYNAGKVCITSTQTILESFLGRYIPEFLQENPDIRLTLNQRDGGFYYHPQANEIFIGCWEYNTENFLYLPYHRFTQKLWASRKYLDKSPPIATIEDMMYHRIILAQVHQNQEHYSGNDFVVRRLGIPLSAPNIVYVRSGPRMLDVLAEEGGGVIASSYETTRLNNLHLEPVLPEVEGEEVSFFVKIDKKFMENPLAKYVTDWIFKCRDRALREIDSEPQSPYVPFYNAGDIAAMQDEEAEE